MLAVGAVLLLTFAVSCGGGDDKTIDLPGDGDLTVSKDDPPEGFPDDFPVYDGADFIGGSSQTVDGAKALNASWETDDDASDVQEFYTDKLNSGNWRTLSTATLNDTLSITFERDGGDATGQVSVVDDGGTTTIVVVIGEGFADTGGDDGSDGSGGDATDTPDDSGSGTSDDDLPDEVDLPSDFPADRVPLPDDARVTQAVTATADGATSYVLQFYSEDSVEEVADHFKSELEGNGFAQSFTSSQNGAVTAIYAENEDGTGIAVTVTVTVSEVPGYTSTALQVITP
jgi:hypothetical protein